MLRLLSKLKEDLAHNGVEVVNSTLQGDTIKLMCSANGRRDTELNAYIIPDGDGFNFYTQAPSEGKSNEIKLTEEQIVPTIISKVDPNKPYVVENQEATETTEDLQDEIKIEVEDGVFDTKVVKHNSYNNSRYAYSSKYGKMGTIVEIRTLNSNIKYPSNEDLVEMAKSSGFKMLDLRQIKPMIRRVLKGYESGMSESDITNLYKKNIGKEFGLSPTRDTFIVKFASWLVKNSNK